VLALGARAAACSSTGSSTSPKHTATWRNRPRCRASHNAPAATIYYIELFAERHAQAHGQAPVLALMPVPGEVDIVIASELMEAGRAMQRGLVTPQRTTLIASSHRDYATLEKVMPGNGIADAGACWHRRSSMRSASSTTTCRRSRARPAA